MICHCSICLSAPNPTDVSEKTKNRHIITYGDGRNFLLSDFLRGAGTDELLHNHCLPDHTIFDRPLYLFLEKLGAMLHHKPITLT